MKILDRINKQAELIHSLVDELEAERSYRGVERLVQLTIQALMDLGLMVISALGREPRSYSEIGYVLQELGVLSESDAELMRSMAGLRNMLVHAYATVNRISEFSRRLKSDALRISSEIVSKVQERGVDPEENAGEIVEKLAKALKGRVKAAYLFGGRAKGYLLRGDYDVAVLMKEGYSLYELGEVQVKLAEALGVREEKVDVICLNSAPPELVVEALRGVPIVEEDPGEMLSLKVRALAELLDLRESKARLHVR